MGSNGGVFSLVVRDSRFDSFLDASDYLRKRLDAIRVGRRAAGQQNVQPTFIDVERTHVLFIHAAYRPYVATAAEYTKVQPSGDKTGSITDSGGTCVFAFPIFGHFTSDMALHVRVSPIGSLSAAAPTAQTPYLRYCALPGVRLLDLVEFKSDQVLVDDYTPDDVIAYSKFFVQADSRDGWERCNGQQALQEADYLANGYTGCLMFRDGPQTPKLYQPGFDMFIPVQFGFCQDASSALLNDLIPNTQRTVVVHFSRLSSIVQALIPDPQDATRLITTPLPFTSLKLDINLYVNNLYVNPEIHDIFASRVGFTLIRVHRRQKNQLQSSQGSFLMDQLKFPAEYFLLGFRDRSLATDFDRWYLMGSIPPRTNANTLVTPAAIWNSNLQVYQLVVRVATEVSALASIVDTLGVTAHGVTMYPELPSVFYSSYLPVRYFMNSLVVSPMDPGAFMVSFCLYPGKFNPSGHYNLSAGRELYINFKLLNESISPGSAEMVTSMSALNFLVRRGDTVALRFSM